MPDEILNNVLHNVRINPHVEFTFITDSVDRITQRMPSDAPPNLHIEHLDVHANLADYPLTKKLAKAMIPACPQGAKDLWAYVYLSRNAGIWCDGDVKFLEPLPLPFEITGNLAVHLGNENSLMAFTGSAIGDPFADILSKMEEKISQLFDIQETPEGTHFVLNANIRTWIQNRRRNSVSTVVDKLQFTHYEATADNNQVRDLRDYIRYTVPNSSYSKGKTFPPTVFAHTVRLTLPPPRPAALRERPPNGRDQNLQLVA